MRLNRRTLVVSLVAAVALVARTDAAGPYTFTVIDDPAADRMNGESTSPFGINAAGDIVGAFAIHGFLYRGGTFTTIDVPGAFSTDADGINNAGQIVGNYRDAAGTHGFLYHDGSFTTIDVPGAVTVNGTASWMGCCRPCKHASTPGHS
jgi:probable HAF family extracellular repeat protein